MKLPNKKIVCTGISVILITSLIVIFHIFKCGACLTQNDDRFFNYLSNSFLNKKILKVSDFYKGNWNYVCAVSPGTNMNVLTVVNQYLDKKFTYNKKYSPYITEKHDESAIVFAYADSDQVEIYRITPNKGVYLGGQQACIDKANAAFLKKRDINDIPETPSLKDNNYIEIELINIERN